MTFLLLEKIILFAIKYYFLDLNSNGNIVIYCKDNRPTKLHTSLSSQVIRIGNICKSVGSMKSVRDLELIGRKYKIKVVL